MIEALKPSCQNIFSHSRSLTARDLIGVATARMIFLVSSYLSQTLARCISPAVLLKGREVRQDVKPK